MILKFARRVDGTDWTFVDKITYLSVDKNPLQEKDDHYTCSIRCFQKEDERVPLYFRKDEAVYLLNDDGKTIECLN